MRPFFLCTCASVAKTHHYAPPVGARGSSVQPVTHYAVWPKRMDPKWNKHFWDSQSFWDKALGNYSAYEWSQRTASHSGGCCPSPPQGQSHIYPLSVWFQEGERYMPPLSCLNAFLTLFPILQAKYYHQSTTQIYVCPCCLRKGVTNSLLPFVWQEIFVSYKIKIYNYSQSVNIFSSSPSTYFINHCHLCQFGTRRLHHPVIHCAQSKSVSSMLAPVSVSACAHMCVRTLRCVSGPLQCQSCRNEGLYLCCLTQDRGCNCRRAPVLHHI